MPRFTDEGISAGIIMMWNCLISAIPKGWIFCDGTNGTPDLKDRFVVCHGSTYTVGSTGGTSTHTHGVGTLAVANSVANTTVDVTIPTVAVASHPHTHSMAGDTLDAPTIPPYFVLAFIQKL